MSHLTLSLLVTSLSLYAAGVTVVFDPANPSSGPFPSDALTVADPAQKTGRRVNLPVPDCTADRFGCVLQPVLNRLDGFNLQPRIRVRFSAAVNPGTLRSGIFYVALDNLSNDEPGLNKPGDVIAINEVVYDPATFSAFAKPDSFLDQHRRYALVVTTGVKDMAGDPVAAPLTYVACQNNAALPGPGCPRAADLGLIAGAGFPSSSLVAATVFTTLSATPWLERARDMLVTTDPSFQPGPVVDLANYPGAVWHQQTGTSPVSFTDNQLLFSLLQGISRVAFGTYSSPNYLNAGQTINLPPTAASLPPAGRTEQIQFNVFLPAAPKPPGGYPVAIFGHGLRSDRFASPGAIASSFAAAGWAVIAIDAVGHGLGPLSSVIFTGNKGQLEVPAPGRGVSQSATGAISPGDGCVIFASIPVGIRDCLLQTSVDLMQLTRVLRSGVDLDGDGSVDLNPGRIAYAGHSLGAEYGTVFNAVDLSVPVAALASGGGTTVTVNRMSPFFIPGIAQYLAAVSPSLLNAGNTFDGNWPLRNEPVRVNTVKGALDLQEAFEKLEWLGAPGDPLNFAPHLKSSTLAGVPTKKVLWQYPIGDQTNPNPTETALVRAAGMRETTRVYRADTALAVNPAMPVNPHSYILDIITPANLPVAIAAQSQVVGFIASGGNAIPDPNPSLRPIFGGQNLFEAPDVLTETLNFLNYPLPTLTALSSPSAAAGGPGFSFVVVGTNFAPGSTVQWNGSSRPTAFLGSTQLAATVLANDIVTPGTAQVTVLNPSPGGGASNPLTFTITTGAVIPPPAINPGGVVNSASFGAQLPTGGSFASVFGTNFATSTVAATRIPLPTILGGVSVQINGLLVPLLVVSPQQINLQIPWYLLGQPQATMIVLANGVSSSPVTVSLATYGPALFATNQQGTGQGAILIGGTGVIAAPAGMSPGSRPARRGEFISVFCTGLGPVTNQPPTGGAAPAVPAATANTLPTATIGDISATVSFSGLAPTFVGLYQVNVQVPLDAPVGDAVPVVLSIGGVNSNKVAIAVQ